MGWTPPADQLTPTLKSTENLGCYGLPAVIDESTQ